jgi:nucleoside-diphosphate-sugar epimerase
MVYSEEGLKKNLSLLLDNCKQYVFISSARVYAQSEDLIKETTPRLLDVTDDKQYLSTNEYALAKAREENLLLNSGKKNFTIIRPSITYNTHRLQLGVLEKENWLYRALHGRSIVFSEDINDKLTTMTLGNDVSMGIASIVGQEKAYGETFHITYPESLLWSDVLNIYQNVLKEYLGHTVPIVMTQKSTNLKFKRRIYQVIYCRYFNRTFDNSKIAQYTDISKFTNPQIGLDECLREFIKKPSFLPINWSLEAVNDRVAKEFTPLCEIPTTYDKINYICYRYHLECLLSIINLSFRIINNLKRIFK